MWEEFLHTNATQLTDMTVDMPIILMMRAKSSSFKALSVAMEVMTIISHYPPNPQTTVLQHWVKKNRSYIEKVAIERLYDREHQTIELSSENQLQQIRHVKNMTPMSNLKDGPRILNAHIDDKYDDLILGITVEEMPSMEAKIDINLINQTLKGEYFYFQIRVSSFESARGKINRYNVAASLPIEQQSRSSPMDTNASFVAAGETSATNQDQSLVTISIAKTPSISTRTLSMLVTPTRIEISSSLLETAQQDIAKTSGERNILTEANLQHKNFKTD
ncbi:hypothetical protein ACH5RR_026456 [Cinchona calisaya]|uniref:Uncharacterized protein n=1 Tax=Cinchona calisaya TaxID=153742 RepID=A0ABD2Z3R1_9GENT